MTDKVNERAKKICLSGSVENVIYSNANNGYSVIMLMADDGTDITATGIMPYVAEGEEVILYGEWVKHHEYGLQFSVESYEKRLPDEENAILRYLSSGAVKGIGPITALKIVNRYGEDTFDIIEKHPEWLSDIPGISPKKAAEINRSFVEQTGIRSVMMFCRNFFGGVTSTKIYKKWGAGAVGIIKENPYRLCNELYGISFERADEIAASIGLANDSPARIKSGISSVLNYNANQNGHVCLPEDKLILGSCELLSLDEEKIRTMLEEGISDGEFIAYNKDGRRMIFTKARGNAEATVARRLIAIDGVCPAIDFSDIERLIERTQYECGMTFAPLQYLAIREALRSGVFVLTGGPGTGKTTVIRALMRIFDYLSLDVALVAPTGRAAKRMSEATSSEAKTIHRMLEMERSADDFPIFKRDDKNPISEKVIIVDEASMIDLPLAEAMLRAMRPGTRLILIGDTNQLPSVGAGNILGDIKESGLFRTVCLSEVFRQSEDSLIVTSAHDINEGRIPPLDNRGSDFFFVRSDDHSIGTTVASLIQRRLPKTYGDAIRSKIQLITPSRKGNAGTESLNLILQSELNPPADNKRELKFRAVVFRTGDRVMQVRNNYDVEWEKDGHTGSGIFNGDIGTIIHIDTKDETLKVNFDDRIVEYDYTRLEELEHAYAITVHKSQGSEYPVVIIPVSSCPPMLRTRNLIYTAVTRAQRMVILVGRSDIIADMVANDRHILRYTCLIERLRESERES